MLRRIGEITADLDGHLKVMQQAADYLHASCRHLTAYLKSEDENVVKPYEVAHVLAYTIDAMWAQYEAIAAAKYALGHLEGRLSALPEEDVQESQPTMPSPTISVITRSDEEPVSMEFGDSSVGSAHRPLVDLDPYSTVTDEQPAKGREVTDQ